MPVIIVPRTEWRALPSKKPEPQVLPVQNIIIFPETKTRLCKSGKDCRWRMRKLQKHHMEVLGLPDIKYNFLIGTDGRVYEGTGWNTRAHDTHISDYKELDNFISICYIGDFAGFRPPMYLINSLEKFIKLGIEENFVENNYIRYKVDAKTQELLHIKKTIF